MEIHWRQGFHQSVLLWSSTSTFLLQTSVINSIYYKMDIISLLVLLLEFVVLLSKPIPGFKYLSVHKSIQDYLLVFCKSSCVIVSYKDNCMFHIHWEHPTRFFFFFCLPKNFPSPFLYFVLPQTVLLGYMTDCYQITLSVCWWPLYICNHFVLLWQPVIRVLLSNYFPWFPWI